MNKSIVRRNSPSQLAFRVFAFENAAWSRIDFSGPTLLKKLASLFSKW